MKFVCANCEAVFLRWEGRCSNCGEWGTLEEQQDLSDSKSVAGGSVDLKSVSLISADKIASAKSAKKEQRLDSGSKELNRVLGGGVLSGSVTLISGEPGVGKSTLLTQLAINIASKGKVLYVSGEESPKQFLVRVKRLLKKKGGSTAKTLQNIFVTGEIQVERIDALIAEEKPLVVIVDSIQSVMSSVSKSYPGSISQVRVCGSILTRRAKVSNIPVFIVGQINKEGVIAGPKVLEHTVDCVLYLEGGEFEVFRVMRCIKNRFGATNEIGVFEMTSDGFHDVSNPSEIFLGGESDSPGSCTSALITGSRVVFINVQALVVDHGASPGPLRRVSNGINRSKLEMLCAVMAKHGKVFLSDKDIFLNVSGGFKVDSPSIDLAICKAIKSAVREEVVPSKSFYIGEVGLTGKVTPFYGIESIFKEAKRLGYKEAYSPALKSHLEIPSLKVISLKGVTSL